MPIQSLHEPAGENNQLPDYQNGVSTWMNDNLVTYIEKDVFDSVKNEVIMQHFQKMYHRQGQL